MIVINKEFLNKYNLPNSVWDAESACHVGYTLYNIFDYKHDKENEILKLKPFNEISKVYNIIFTKTPGIQFEEADPNNPMKYIILINYKTNQHRYFKLNYEQFYSDETVVNLGYEPVFVDATDSICDYMVLIDHQL